MRIFPIYKMKTNIKIYVFAAAVALIAILFAAYSKFSGNKNQTNLVNDDKQKGVFSSIKDALSKNVTLICDFKDESGSTVKSYIKNGAVRVTTKDSLNSDRDGEIIMKDKKMYMWDLKTKTGFVYDIPDSTETTDSTGMSGTEVVKSDAYLSMIEKYKDSCKVSSVEDSYFVPPTDIKYQDMSKLLEDLKKQMPQVNLPTQ